MLLFVAVVVVVVIVVMFLPTYFYIGCIQVAGDGTSSGTEILPKVTLGI